nr:hypothetical transcript [Hymenolepis microstoma]
MLVLCQLSLRDKWTRWSVLEKYSCTLNADLCCRGPMKMFGKFPSSSERSSWGRNIIEHDHLHKFSCVIYEDVEKRAALTAPCGKPVCKRYPEFFGCESSCPVKSLQHSTEESTEVVVRPDKDVFSYWSFVSGWS